MEERNDAYSSSLRAPLVRIPEKIKEDENRFGRETIFEELRNQVWLAGPLISVSVLQFCLQLISVMFVGHLGQFASVTGFSLLIFLKLSFDFCNRIVSMAHAFLAVVLASLSVQDFSCPVCTSASQSSCKQMGMTSALDTLCGQSYGAKQYHMLGIHMQRAMFVLLLVSVPLAFVWANTGSILTALGQDPDISREAGLYARFMIPAIFGYGILQCQVKFLQTQNNVFPMMISSGIATLLHLVLCWALVFKSGLGSRGAAVANSISYWINVFILLIYIKFSPSCSKTWTGFSKEALHDVLNFIRLAVPSAVMVCLEAWSFEMMVLLSGLLPNPELETSVLSICLNTASTFWMIPFGLSCAVSTRVSNELGAGRPQAAHLAVGVVLFIAISEGILVGLVILLIRNMWGFAYSNETEVVTYVATMMPILAASNFLDGLQTVLSGTVRGIGWQKIGACINLGSYYLVGIPMAILLGFVCHIGGKGMWLGILCALVVQVVCLFVIILRTNWEQEANKAKERVFDSTIPEEILS